MFDCRSRAWLRRTGAFAAGMLAASAWAAPVYRIEAIPDADGMRPTVARSINERGVVVGKGLGRARGGEAAQSDRAVPFRYRDGIAERLKLGDADSGYILAINKRGEMVGERDYGTIWNPKGKPRGLATPPQCNGNVYAYDNNNAGEVVGSVHCVGGPYRRIPTLHVDGVGTELPILPGHNEATARAINNAGQIVGNSEYFDEEKYVSYAVLWQDRVIHHLDAFGSWYSFATDINDQGTIVGQYDDWDSADMEPFRYSLGKMEKLPNCGGRMFPQALNNAGAIAGGTYIYTDSRNHAAVIDGGACMFLKDLLDESKAGWELLFAYDINDAGTIVGGGIFEGQERAFIATRLAP